MPRSGYWVGKAVEGRDWDPNEEISKIGQMVWNPATLQWERMVNPAPLTGSTVTGSITGVGQGVGAAIAGYSSASFDISGTFSGSLRFEGSTNGGLTYPFTVQVEDKFDGAIVVATTFFGNFIPISIGGLTHIRVAAITWTSGTANIILNLTAATRDLSAATSGTEGAVIPTAGLQISAQDEFGLVQYPRIFTIRPSSSDPGLLVRPINHATSRIKRTYDWTGAVAATAIWTPASGKKFVITGFAISISAACTVTLIDTTSAGTTDTLGTATTEGTRVAKYYFAANSGAVRDWVQEYTSSTANNSLKIITSAAGGSISVEGYET